MLSYSILFRVLEKILGLYHFFEKLENITNFTAGMTRFYDNTGILA